MALQVQNIRKVDTSTIEVGSHNNTIANSSKNKFSDFLILKLI